MSDKRYTLEVIIFNAVFSLILSIFFVNSLNVLNCVNACKKIECIPFQMARIVLYGFSHEESSDTISGRLALMDTKGNEIAVIERSWQGNYLFMDFTKADISEKNFYFPYMIRSTERLYEKKSRFRRRKGTYLYPYFMENRQCLLFSNSEGESSRRNLYKVAEFSRNPGIMYFSDITKNIVVNLSECQSGVYYGIFLNEEGKLVLREE